PLDPDPGATAVSALALTQQLERVDPVRASVLAEAEEDHPGRLSHEADYLRAARSRYTRARPHPGGGGHPPPTAIEFTGSRCAGLCRFRAERASRAGGRSPVHGVTRRRRRAGLRRPAPGPPRRSA